jgi:FixJ family two-component response regulator
VDVRVLLPDASGALSASVVALLGGNAVGAPPRAAEALRRLTDAEREVAALIAEGFQSLQIAATLGKSVHTVRRAAGVDLSQARRRKSHRARGADSSRDGSLRRRRAALG